MQYNVGKKVSLKIYLFRSSLQPKPTIAPDVQCDLNQNNNTEKYYNMTWLDLYLGLIIVKIPGDTGSAGGH